MAINANAVLNPKLIPKTDWAETEGPGWVLLPPNQTSMTAGRGVRCHRHACQMNVVSLIISSDVMARDQPWVPRSEPLPRVVAVGAGGAAGAVGFVRVLVGLGELLFHQGIVLSAVLGTGRQTVPALASPLAVVILVGAHEAAPLHGRVVCRVGAVPPALALRGPRTPRLIGSTPESPLSGAGLLCSCPAPRRPSSSLVALTLQPRPAAGSAPARLPGAGSSAC